MALPPFFSTATPISLASRCALTTMPLAAGRRRRRGGLGRRSESNESQRGSDRCAPHFPFSPGRKRHAATAAWRTCPRPAGRVENQVCSIFSGRELLHFGQRALLHLGEHRLLHRLHVGKAEELPRFQRRAIDVDGHFHRTFPSGAPIGAQIAQKSSGGRGALDAVAQHRRTMRGPKRRHVAGRLDPLFRAAAPKSPRPKACAPPSPPRIAGPSPPASRR